MKRLGMTLARQLERDQIRVNVVCPGNVDTPLKVDIIEQQVEAIGEDAHRDDQLAGLVDPGGIASIITFLLSSDADLLRGAVFTREALSTRAGLWILDRSTAGR